MKIEKMSDVFSPVVVKEIRQGLNSMYFAPTFLGAHLAFILLSLGQLLSKMAGDTGTSDAGILFWIIIGGLLVLFYPSTAINTIEAEKNARTIDLVLMTDLNAFRMLSGKWYALILQVLMIVVSFLPYFALRYFLGGVDLVSELFILIYCCSLSIFLTAFCLACSAVDGKFLRFLIIAGLFWVTMASFPLMAAFLTIDGIWLKLALVSVVFIYAGVYGLVAVLTGANFIAARAENYTFPARFLLVGAAISLSGLAYVVPQVNNELKIFIVVMTWLGVIASGVLPASIWSPALYRPFARRGKAGRVVGCLGGYPGLAGGMLLALIGVLVLWVIAPPTRGLYAMALPGPVFIVGAIHILLKRYNFTPFKAIMLYMIGVFVVMMLFIMLEEIMGLVPMNSSETLFHFLVPLANLQFVMELRSVPGEQAYAALLSTLIAFSICAVSWFKEVRHVPKMEALALGGMKELEEEANGDTPQS